MAGKVWLVGAGPGDLGLLTIKGREILEQAEVVVYDRLGGEGILRLIPRESEAIDVGKRAGSHTMAQQQINELLLEQALQGKRVVRLKGGDPFLFGRGGEELQLLARHGVPFEVVPGVTSAFAVPAYGGIPVTHRELASSVHVITGHKKEGERLQLDYEALVRLKGTLVFLMSVFAISDICQGLLAAGMESKMPVAVVQQGTGAAQKKINSDLGNLPDVIRKKKVQTPAVLIVGNVCALGNELQWYEKQPLFAKKILVTRPKERSGTLSGRLRSMGAEVLELPAIRIERLQENHGLEKELQRLSGYHYMAFTSPAGVDLFFDELKRRRQDIRALGSAQLAAIGPGTKKALEEKGLLCALMPDVYDGRHLGILLGETLKMGERILIPRAEQGTPELTEEIKKRTQAQITELPIYRIVYENPSPIIDVKGQIERGAIDLAIFTSASTVHGFAAALPGLAFDLVHAVCIGAQTQKAAEALGMRTVMAEKATLDHLVEACLKAAKEPAWQERAVDTEGGR